jgi:hypothetical protein
LYILIVTIKYSTIVEENPANIYCRVIENKNCSVKKSIKILQGGMRK